jgi:hypothetical protein
MDALSPQAKARATYRRLDGSHDRLRVAVSRWLRSVRPYGKRKPAAIRLISKQFNALFADAEIVHRESDFRTIGSRYSNRAQARAAVLCAAANEDKWALPQLGALARQEIGRERSFFLLSYAMVARKTKLILYSNMLPWSITFHAYGRFVERCETSASGLFTERLMPALLLCAPLCRAIGHKDSRADASALVLPYGDDLFLGVPRPVLVEQIEQSDIWKYVIDRYGLHEFVMSTSNKMVLMAQVHSFVDYNQLSASQDEIVRVLNAFYTRHQEKLWALFRLETFVGMDRDGEGDEDVPARIKELSAELVDLLLPIVNQPLWRKCVRPPKENWLTNRHRETDRNTVPV